MNFKVWANVNKKFEGENYDHLFGIKASKEHQPIFVILNACFRLISTNEPSAVVPHVESGNHSRNNLNRFKFLWCASSFYPCYIQIKQSQT